MKRFLGTFAVILGLASASLAQTNQAQTKLEFDVASIKPSAPLDPMKMAADMQAGKMPRLGVHIDGSQAEYLYLSLKDLMVMAYKVKPYQITGPDWLGKQRFDIRAKMPSGSKKDDAPKMLQALLEDRFKLKVHSSKAEHPVLALVVGKGGPKLKESAEKPKPIDENAELGAGEMVQQGPDGPVKMTMGKTPGSATVNMGAKGMMSYGMGAGNQSFHLDGKMLTMSGFADMLTQFMSMGGGGGRQITDMTGLTGYYDIAMDFSISDLMQMARSAGVDIPGAPGSGGAPAVSAADAASDPASSTSSVTAAVQAVGLKLENRKAMVEQLIVDSAEKSPTEN